MSAGTNVMNQPEKLAEKAKRLSEDSPLMLPENIEKRKNALMGRRAFKYIFAEYLDDKKRSNIVKSFCDLLISEKVAVKDRIHLLELILRVLGEDGTLSASEYKDLSGVITLQIQ